MTLSVVAVVFHLRWQADGITATAESPSFFAWWLGAIIMAMGVWMGGMGLMFLINHAHNDRYHWTTWVGRIILGAIIFLMGVLIVPHN